MSHIGNNNMEKNPKYSEIKSYGKKEVGREGRRERESVSRKGGGELCPERLGERKAQPLSSIYLIFCKTNEIKPL